MILYFITGFISGVIGTLMLGKYVSRKMEMMDDDKRSE